MAPFVNLDLIKFGVLNCGYLADVKVYNIYLKSLKLTQYPAKINKA